MGDGPRTMEDVKRLAAEHCLAPIGQTDALYMWEQVTGRTSGEMSEEEGKRAVQFLNDFLGDDVQLSLENAKTMGLDNCIREGAAASQNASNTLSCVVSAINDWSGAKEGTCRSQTRDKDSKWFPKAKEAWEAYKARQVEVAACPISDREKALNFWNDPKYTCDYM